MEEVRTTHTAVSAAPTGMRSDYVHVYEGLTKKRFPAADDSVLLSRIRKDWYRVDSVATRPPQPEMLRYPRSLLIKAEHASGQTFYHVLPVWFFMIPSILKALIPASALLGGFTYLALRWYTSTSLEWQYADAVITTFSMLSFLTSFLSATLIRSQLAGLKHFRSVEFTDTADSLRRVMTTFMIENRKAIVFTFAMFYLGLTTMLGGLMCFLWNRLSENNANGTASGLGPAASEADDIEGDGLANWIIATALMGFFNFILWPILTWRLMKKGTYLLSLDRNVLLHH